MADQEQKGLDVLGIEPISDAVRHASNTAIDGAAGLLRRICMPAAEEFGLLLRDKMRVYRAQNLANVLIKADKKLAARLAKENLTIHPRLLAAVLDGASWTDDDILQEAWAGLIAAACCRDGKDESNLIFTRLLAQLTAAQARLMNDACLNSDKQVGPNGLIQPRGSYNVSSATLLQVSGLPDIHQLDMALDSLRELGLIVQGFSMFQGSAEGANMTVSSLGLNLFVRCQGYVGSAADYFGVVPPKPVAVEVELSEDR